MKILGRKIAIFDFTSGAPKPFGAATSCTLNVNTDMVGMAALASRAKNVKPGKYGWSITVDALYDVNEAKSDMQTRLLRAQLEGAKLRFRMAEVIPDTYPLEPSGQHTEYEGDVYVASWSANAGDGMGTFNVTLQGTGELDIL
jgi:hypothetical protein